MKQYLFNLFIAVNCSEERYIKAKIIYLSSNKKNGNKKISSHKVLSFFLCFIGIFLFAVLVFSVYKIYTYLSTVMSFFI